MRPTGSSPDARRPVPVRCVLWGRPIAALVLLLAAAGVARAQPGAGGDPLVEAGAALAAGDHQRALALAAPARDDGPAADRAEAWRITGVAHFFLGQQDAARADFAACLRLFPDATLDPALYPPEVLALFDSVRHDLAAELAAARPKPRRKRSAWLSVVPVVAQWQNGDTTKMWIVGSAITALAIANGTSFYLLHRWCDTSDGTCDEGNPGEDGYSDHLPEARRARTVNVVSAVGLLGVITYSVVDGVLGYRRLAREDQEESPPAIGVGATDSGLSVLVRGRF
ncbi:MAG TPA: tetratricopeptide repeat protein [Kofleriaceae bacterium]|nr:tetratricopeptide repeat protein [Kofleriaceae bacterium]